MCIVIYKYKSNVTFEICFTEKFTISHVHIKENILTKNPYIINNRILLLSLYYYHFLSKADFYPTNYLPCENLDRWNGFSL